jgi:hypothetical protein
VGFRDIPRLLLNFKKFTRGCRVCVPKNCGDLRLSAGICGCLRRKLTSKMYSIAPLTTRTAQT